MRHAPRAPPLRDPRRPGRPAAAAAQPASIEVDARVAVEVAVDVAVDVGAGAAVDAAPVVVTAAPVAGVDAAPVVLTAAPAAEGTPLDGHRWEAGVGVLVTPSFSAGALDAKEAAGVHAALGRQLGPWRLAAEYSFLPFDGCVDAYDAGGRWMGWDDYPGQLHRLGAAARYRVGVGAPEVAAGLYVEAGVGRQAIRLEEGGGATRHDVALGLGFEMAGGISRIVGMDLGVRATAAPAPTSGVPGARPGDATTDVTVGFVLGLLVGG